MNVGLAQEALQFRILGPLAVESDGESLDVGAPKQRILLALLLLSPNESVSPDRLIDALWGERPPEAAQNALHVYVSRLRKVLGSDRISTASGGYSALVKPDELDLARFRTLVGEARRVKRETDPATAANRFRVALDLWRGVPFADLAYSSALEPEIARLEEERLSVVEERVAADLEIGLHAEVVSELEGLVAANPLRECLVSQLMLALYRSGRQAEGLEIYRRARHRLVDELGIEPGPVLNELHQQILAQDRSLEPPPVARRPSGAHPSRRHLTLLVSGLSLPVRLDPELAVRVLARARQAVCEVLERHGAVVDAPLGDTVVGAFGLPAVHEDDPISALRAARELVSVLKPMQVQVRVSVDSGAVLANDDGLLDDQVAGWMMHLNEAAGKDEVVIGAGTRQLVRGAAELVEVVSNAAWKLVALDPEADPIGRRLDAPLVGRESEVERLRDAYAWVVRNQKSHLLTVLGPAGIGKSRLARELSTLLSDEATFLGGRCRAHGHGALWPLGEIVTQAAGDTTRAALDRLLAGVEDARLIVDQVTAALGTAEGARAEDAFWAFRRLFAALAAPRPLVLIFEDLHWGEERLLELIEDVVRRAADAPILILGLSRPELLENNPSWGGGGLDAESIQLEPLNEQSSSFLIELLGKALRQDSRGQILERAEGNPLFIEQMVALASEDPEAGPESIPPSINAVLSTRLDRLARSERDLLERASIIGLEFSLDAVAGLSRGEAKEQTPDVASELVRKELLRADGPELRERKQFRFRHILIREVVYDSVLKSTRAELHEHFARWLEQRAIERPAESDEIIGYHLERAYHLAHELDPEEERLPALAKEAGERLVAAGRHQVARSDTSAAIDLLTRGLRLLSEDAPTRGEALAELAYVFRLRGEWDLARSCLKEGFGFAVSQRDDALNAYLTVSELQLRLHTEPEFELDEFIRVASRSLRALESNPPNDYTQRVRISLAWPYALRGQSQIAERLIEAVSLQPGRVGEARKLLPSIWLNGPLPASAAISKCERLLRENPTPRIAASCYRSLAVLKALSGSFAEARNLVERDRAILEELGLRVLAGAASSVRAEVELLAGDAVAAERILRRGIDELQRYGSTMYTSGLVALLGRALVEQGREEEAATVLESANLTPPQDAAAAVELASITARVLAHQMRLLEAVRIARRATELAAATDSPELQANALIVLGEILSSARRFDAARRSFHAAIELCNQKEDRVLLARAETLLEALPKHRRHGVI